VVAEEAARLFHEMLLQIPNFKVTHGAMKAFAVLRCNVQGMFGVAF
jgi:hypothetical protein